MRSSLPHRKINGLSAAAGLFLALTIMTYTCLLLTSTTALAQPPKNGAVVTQTPAQPAAQTAAVKAPAARPAAAPARAPIKVDPAFDLNRTMASPQFTGTVQMMIALALISLIPFFLISVTSFIRIAVVLSMIRSAIGTQQVPPNTVIISLSLFMTIFVMNPVWQKIDKTAYTPYRQGQISQAVAWEKGMIPLRDFMLKQTRQQDLALFVEFAKIPPIKTLDDVPTYVIIPAFAISELKTAFQIGFVIFLPFLVVDMVVANVLLSLGMFMLSPVMVSLPFKILLFVLADGWNLICRGLMSSFS